MATALIPNKILLSSFSNKDIQLTKKDVDLILILSSLVTKDGPQEFVINKQELAEQFRLNRNTLYRDLRDSLIRLQSFVFNLAEEAPKKGKFVNIFHHENDQDSSEIKITFSKEMHSLLCNLSEGNYSHIDIDTVLSFKYLYTKRLYMVLSRYETGQSPEFSIADLRAMLGVLQDEYTLTADFLKRCVIPAQVELLKVDENGNFISDRQFNIQYIKTGKKITGVKLHILKTDQKLIVIHRTGHAKELWDKLGDKEGNSYNKHYANQKIIIDTLRGYKLPELRIQTLLTKIEKQGFTAFFAAYPTLLLLKLNIQWKFKSPDGREFDEWKAQKLIERVPADKLTAVCTEIQNELKKSEAGTRKKILNPASFAYWWFVDAFGKETIDGEYYTKNKTLKQAA